MWRGMYKFVLRIRLGEMHGKRCASSEKDQPHQLCHGLHKLGLTQEAAPWDWGDAKSSTDGTDEDTASFETQSIHEYGGQINRNVGLDKPCG